MSSSPASSDDEATKLPECKEEKIFFLSDDEEEVEKSEEPSITTSKDQATEDTEGQIPVENLLVEEPNLEETKKKYSESDSSSTSSDSSSSSESSEEDENIFENSGDISISKLKSNIDFDISEDEKEEEDKKSEMDDSEDVTMSIDDASVSLKEELEKNIDQFILNQENNFLTDTISQGINGIIKVYNFLSTITI